MRWILLIIAGLILAGLIISVMVTRDGSAITPRGEGQVLIGEKAFEAFPLPDYAAAAVSADYKSYFVEVEPGIKVHVLDVGTGFPVYLQHGNPTSGFLYRKVAAALPTDQVRLIMPTMVGLGFSSKVPASAHTLDNHISWMNAVLEALELEQVIYVGQDWGGPVGMGALSRSPGMLAGVVAMNTGFNAPREARALSRIHALVKTPVLGELLVEVVSSAFSRLHAMQGDPDSIPPEVASLYGRPVTESGNAKAPLALMRMVPDGPEHPSAAQMREIEAYVSSLDVPAELVWGMRDPILAQGLSAMQANFPEASLTETEAGHFLQEEVPTVIAEAILRLVMQVQENEQGPE